MAQGEQSKTAINFTNRRIKIYCSPMATIRLGQGVTDVRGKLGGVHFTRDKSGLHCSAMARHVRHRSTGQARQRNAFRKARSQTSDLTDMAHLIYRCLTGLD